MSELITKEDRLSVAPMTLRAARGRIDTHPTQQKFRWEAA